ncbi:MAG: MFS transporter [Bacteroidetes bacterium]|nr:MFS transporter [Bacteroidota bacterium]MBU1718883.1 MFS transporter [Bacteroidota bacterium]
MRRFFYSYVYRALPIMLPALFLLGCGGGSDVDDVTDVDTASQQNISSKITENIFYKIPSPAELYIFLKESGSKFNKDATNPTSNVSKYNTTYSKALNFGIYASDLAYTSMFEQNQQTLDYYAVAKQLGDELGLMEGFDQDVADRIDKNINNPDSLYRITSEAYWDAYTFLEANDKTNILPYISIGSWLESVHIAIKSVNKFSAENEVVIRVAEQEMLLENLLAFLYTAEKADQLDNIINDLKELMTIYEELYDNTDEIITEAQFKKVSAKVEQMRNSFIS